jgi:hypothetical protein
MYTTHDAGVHRHILQLLQTTLLQVAASASQSPAKGSHNMQAHATAGSLHH